MSAYVNRLLERFSPGQVNTAAAAEPFVRSHSPIADFDQRPGGEDAFGLEPGAPDVSPELEAPPGVAPTARIQRKAMSQSIAAMSAPAPTPTPTPLTPSIAAPPVALPAPTPRSEPLDPGPLFDIVPRYFDAGEPGPALSNQPSIVEAPSEPISPSAKARPTTFDVDATPRRLSPASRREPELPSPTVEAPPRPAPWVAFERDIPEPAPLERPRVNPATPRHPTPLSPTVAPAPALEQPSPAPLHYAAPRATTAAPYVPDPGPRASAEQSVNARPRVHIGRVEIEVIPSNSSSPAQSGAAAPKQKLSIDSISQIGPLGHHFPSRRLLRLRYR